MVRGHGHVNIVGKYHHRPRKLKLHAGEYLTQCNRPANGPKMTVFRLWPENGTPYEKFTNGKIDGLGLFYRLVATLRPYIHKLTRQGAPKCQNRQKSPIRVYLGVYNPKPVATTP